MVCSVSVTSDASKCRLNIGIIRVIVRLTSLSVSQMVRIICVLNGFFPGFCFLPSPVVAGDVEDVGNYRPICSLLALYKLFTTVLYSRLYPRLDQIQSEDQAGFRRTYQAMDHLTTYRMIEQKCHEWGVEIWVATIDFMKAFDSVTHNSIWDALKSCGIEHEYINLLKRSYKNQIAAVMTDKESDMFEIKKETKQGDPLSSLLFNTVLQVGLKDGLPRWQKKKGMGICLGDNDHDCITNLRFVDDVLLFASTKEQLQKMLCKRWDSRYIQEKRRFLEAEARTVEKKLG